MTFADLHRGKLPLLLPNAWDVPSALALLECGFTAIGTTSFGVASSIGRPDGGRSTREANLGLAAALRPLDCYTSLDIEDGYADDPDEVADYVARLPVDGINIEDSTAEKLLDPQQHVAKVQAIKQRSPDVFVNARVDTYWLGQDATVAATLDRAAQYGEAGADGIFVPGASEPDNRHAIDGQLLVSDSNASASRRSVDVTKNGFALFRLNDPKGAGGHRRVDRLRITFEDRDVRRHLHVVIRVTACANRFARE